MKERPALQSLEQSSQYTSPWPLRQRLTRALWGICWTLFCSWTPKPLNRWRLFWLRLFGVKIEGSAFVHQRVRISIPWNLTLGHRACLGSRVNVYNLGKIEIAARATVAQEAYLCAGTHDFDQPHLPMVIGKITIGENVFIGARAFVFPGVTIGRDSIIGACSVVTKDMPAGMICHGHPCQPIRPRKLPE